MIKAIVCIATLLVLSILWLLLLLSSAANTLVGLVKNRTGVKNG